MDDTQPDQLDAALGAAVRRRRRERDISQADLGRAVGVSFQQVQKYERGTNRISFSALNRVCEALGCTVGELAASVEGAATGPAVGRPIVDREAVGVLEAMTEISSPQIRRAIVDFARALARDASAGQGD